VSGFFSSFLAPAAFALLAIAPLIVLMYLLKLKRRPQMVSSTLLWRRSVQDLIANAPFQRLRNNLLLWIQLLILLLLVLALARPVMRLSGLGGDTIIVLIDQSASMQTIEEDGQTRLEKAKKLAMEAVDSMSGGNSLLGSFGKRDEMMIIGIADTPMPLQPMTSDKGALRNALNKTEALDTEVNLTDLGYILHEKTMIKKGDVYEPNPRARVILLTDGGLGNTLASLTDVPNVEYTSIGKTIDNIGFTAIDVRESFAGTFEYQIFASMQNADENERTAYVELVVAGETLDLKKVVLPPRGKNAVVFTVSEDVRGLATLTMVDHVDAFTLDDMIQANVSPPTSLNVQIVTDGNPYLQAVFAVDPRANITLSSTSNFQLLDNQDIVVFDGWSPKELPPGNYIFLNTAPPDDFGYVFTGETIKNPNIIDWSRVHRITRGTNFERVLLAEAQKIQAPKEAVALVEAVDTDLISYLETETRRAVVIAFDPGASYWPVDVSFVFFFNNLIDYWSRSATGLNKPAYTTGQTIPIVPPREASTAAIMLPGGEKLEYSLDGQATIYLSDTKEKGIYTVAYDTGNSLSFPINLQSGLESDIAVVPELTLAGKTITAIDGKIKTRQEIWPWLALAALAFLMLEWAIYCKRTFM
jgi:aerotolerance regulator-like protein/VWA domain-containing protein